MLQRIWALLPLLLVAFVAAGLELASEATRTDKKVVVSPSPFSSVSKLSDKYNKSQRDLLTKQVEKSLLSMFGLSDRPKPKSNVTVSDYMWELYRKQTQLNKNFLGKPTVNTIRCFRGKEKDHPESHRASFRFDVNDIPNHEDVWNAELVLYRPMGPKTSFAKRVQVFDVLRPHSGQSGSGPIQRLVDTRVLGVKSTTNGRWESFDVLPALHRWRSDPSTNHGLHVELSTGDNTTAQHHLRLKREIGETHEQWKVYQPLLVTYSRDSRDTFTKASSRTHRSTRKHRRKGRKDNCRRHALYVDFSDVGWNDWIVAPPGYDAYFCHGECPFPLADHLNSTNHAIVQTLMNSVNPAAVPRACCVPTELSPISMLYVDEYDKVVLKNYQDMVVEGCGCR